MIPKEVRKRATIWDGSKLALVSGMNREELCCLALLHTDNPSSEVSGVMHSLRAEKA